MHPRAKLALVATLMTIPVSSPAAEGVDRSTVKFAQVAALDGPAAALGTGMRQGILAAFEEANRNGGVHGRKVTLDSFDDGYEPSRSVEQTRAVVEGDDHIALIGPVGTPTTKATQPIASDAGLPFIGAFTGADFLRAPWSTNVINIRATYGAETEAWIAHLVDRLGMDRIAILYQDDGFGRVGLAGVRAAMDRRNLALVAEGKYVRNTKAVKVALLNIRKEKPDAVVMVGAYAPVAEFVRVGKALDFEPSFVNISFVGSKALAAELGPDGEGVIVSQVVPFPWDASRPVVADYQAALAALDPGAEPGFVSLEGYLAGRVALAGLEAAGTWLTRERYLEALRGLGEFDLGGLTLHYGPGDNQGLDDVFLTRIDAEGGFEPVPPPGDGPDS